MRIKSISQRIDVRHEFPQSYLNKMAAEAVENLRRENKLLRRSVEIVPDLGGNKDYHRVYGYKATITYERPIVLGQTTVRDELSVLAKTTDIPYGSTDDFIHRPRLTVTGLNHAKRWDYEEKDVNLMNYKMDGFYLDIRFRGSLDDFERDQLSRFGTVYETHAVEGFANQPMYELVDRTRHGRQTDPSVSMSTWFSGEFSKDAETAVSNHYKELGEFLNHYGIVANAKMGSTTISDYMKRHETLSIEDSIDQSNGFFIYDFAPATFIEIVKPLDPSYKTIVEKNGVETIETRAKVATYTFIHDSPEMVAARARDMAA